MNLRKATRNTPPGWSPAILSSRYCSTRCMPGYSSPSCRSGLDARFGGKRCLVTLLKSVFIYLGIPFLLMLTRFMSAWRGENRGREKLYSENQPHQAHALFTSGDVRVSGLYRPAAYAVGAIPLLIYFVVIFLVSSHGVASSLPNTRDHDWSFTAASNNFEWRSRPDCGIAWINRAQVVGAVIGPLVEVPALSDWLKFPLSQRCYFGERPRNRSRHSCR